MSPARRFLSCLLAATAAFALAAPALAAGGVSVSSYYWEVLRGSKTFKVMEGGTVSYCKREPVLVLGAEIVVSGGSKREDLADGIVGPAPLGSTDVTDDSPSAKGKINSGYATGDFSRGAHGFGSFPPGTYRDRLFVDGHPAFSEALTLVQSAACPKPHTVLARPASRAARMSASSGSVCALLSAAQVPADVQPKCYPQPVNRTIPGEPNYSAIIGTSLAHEIKLTLSRPSDRESLSLFKQMPSLVASATNSKVVVVQVGSWAREVRYVGAGGRHYAQVGFLASGYMCLELFADPASNGEVLSLARAIASRL